MYNNRAHFSNFVECEGVVQVYNNEGILSYSVGTVRIMTMVDGVMHYVTLNDVMYTAGIMHNIISIAPVRKNRFRVQIDDDPSNAKHGRMDLHHKPSGEVKIYGYKTREGLYNAITRVPEPGARHSD